MATFPKKEEIEEMAAFIHGRRDKVGSYKTAETLINAGYRKADKVRKETVEKILELIKNAHWTWILDTSENKEGYAITDIEATIAKIAEYAEEAKIEE